MARESERIFTREEANRLLPRLRPLVERAQAAHRRLVAGGRLRRLAAVAGGNGGGDTAVEVLAAEAQLRRAVSAIERLGVIVRDPAVGLCDFPSVRGGEPIFLCWRLDEPSVDYWHSRDEGFAGRQPL